MRYENKLTENVAKNKILNKNKQNQEVTFSAVPFHCRLYPTPSWLPFDVPLDQQVFQLAFSFEWNLHSQEHAFVCSPLTNSVGIDVVRFSH